jgi:hypothetical protein
MKRVKALMRALWQLARELADENAYARHLAHSHVQHSAEEWRRFSDAKLRRKYQQGKCC